jgi:hypothetical protein
MAVIASVTAVGTAVSFGALTGVGATVLGGALIGAGVGGIYSAVTGDGDILNSMLTGGLIGGAAGGIAGAAAAPAATGATGTGATGAAASTVNTVTPAMEAASLLEAAAVTEGGAQAGMVSQYAAQEAAAKLAAEELAKKTAATALTGKEVLGYGLAGTAAMQMLGGKGTGANAPTDPGMVRPYQFSSNPTAATGNFPSPYATAQYDAAGMPIMDTRERNYFDQKYAALTPYSAKTGTVNPNAPIAAARGGLMAIGGPVERMSQNVMGGQGNMFPLSQQEHTNFATPTQMPASAEIIRSDYDAKTQPYTGVMMANGGIARFADKGAVDEEAELRKTVMNNLKRLAPDQLQNVMGFMDQKETEQQFLMKHMPNYAESMRPTISGMVEGAQYGDRMSKSFIDKARENAIKSGNDFQEPSQNYARITPTMVNPESGMYGGIASIGRQVDPNTRVNMMADLQRTPYDRNAMESVRRVGAGVDRRIGKDANLSAYYEQDPMGRNKAGGVRYTKNFSVGGVSYDPKNQTYSGTGIAQAPAAPAVSLPPLAADLVSSLTPQWQAANPYKYAYDAKNQKYSAATPDMNQLHAFKAEQDRVAAEAAAAASQGYQGYAMGGDVMDYGLGGYSDGGRLLRGPGDGVSDDIPATIAGKQPARLADGEFVIPARIVSEIGNGSTDAGAKRLYAMMDRIQDGRKKTIGKKNIAKDTKAKKHLLA